MKPRAFLFDLHHTLTGTRSSPLELLREVGRDLEVDLQRFSDEELEQAFQKSDSWLNAELVRSNVDVHWGNDPTEWLQADRIMFEALGLSNLSDERILKFEKSWKEAVRSPEYEYLTGEALETLVALYDRNYTLGICTRRFHDPSNLIESSGIEKIISVVTWSGVPGYAKPNPYTLLDAAEKIHMNPRCCAYVGNLVEADIEAAIRAEMIPILTTWSDATEVEKAPEGITVVESLRRLLEIFE